jgi:hypothetical protein
MALRDRISGEPSACAFSPDVMLRIAIGRASPVPSVGMINCIRTGERAWSKHGWETAVNQGKGMAKIPGQGYVVGTSRLKMHLDL